jgi:ligand-binding SRPBCC domain-containing protein
MLWMGPIPVRWRVRIEQMQSDSFTDHMIEGPFRTWRHRHAFRALDDNRTEVLDEIDFSLRPHMLWGSIGLAMAVGLPLLFFYRARKTVQLIIRERDSGKNDLLD